MNEQPVPAAADFLGRLVNRARGEDGGLRPRLPSLFEPTHFSGVGMADDPEPAAPIDEAADDVLQPAREDSGIRDRHTAGVAEAQWDQTPTLGAGQQHALAEFPEIGAGPAPAAPPAILPARLRAQPVIAALHDHDAPALLPRITRAALFDAGDDSRAAADGVLVAAVDGRATPGGLPLLKNAALMVSSDAGVHRIVAESQTTRRRPAPKQAHAEIPAAEVAPIINVTIGRVEVRAMQIPPAPRRTETRSPRPMSLDDYLKRRGGGR